MSAFATLGLDSSATTEQVKANYRELAKKHHPDVNPNDPGAGERFKKITAAYSQALLQSSKRERFGAAQRSRDGVRGARVKPAEPVHPSRYNVREWESAHYGMHQTQSAFVRNLAREQRARQQQARQAVRHMQSASYGGGSGWWVVASLGAAAMLWSAVYRTNVNKFRASKR